MNLNRAIAALNFNRIVNNVQGPNPMSYSVGNKEMGRRIFIARKIAGKKINEVTQDIGISVNRLASIENGSVALQKKEIDSLAYFYGVSPTRFLNRDAIHTDLVPRFRKLSKTEDRHVFEAAKLLNNLFSAESELENLLEIKHFSNYPRDFDIGKGSVKKLAVEHAQFLRKFLKLGVKPIPDIFSVIEKELGIRLYQRKLETGSKILGMFAFDETLGACILLNANYPKPSRVLAAAHELGHFMADRKKIEVLKENDQNNSRSERYAVHFSYAFLMPKESFTSSYHEISDGSDALTRKIVVELANRFHVPVKACIRQLDEYALVEDAEGWCNTIGEISTAEKRKILGSEQYENRYAEVVDANLILPIPMSLLLQKAWNSDVASESYLASILNLNLLEVRKIYYNFEIGRLV